MPITPASGGITDAEIRSTVQNLPETFTVEQVLALCDALQADIGRREQMGATVSHENTMQLLSQHRRLYCAYPMLFRSICRGSYNREAVSVMLEYRDKLNRGEMDTREAMRAVADRAAPLIRAQAQARGTPNPLGGSVVSISGVSSSGVASSAETPPQSSESSESSAPQSSESSESLDDSQILDTN